MAAVAPPFGIGAWRARRNQRPFGRCFVIGRCFVSAARKFDGGPFRTRSAGHTVPLARRTVGPQDAAYHTHGERVNVWSHLFLVCACNRRADARRRSRKAVVVCEPKADGRASWGRHVHQAGRSAWIDAVPPRLLLISPWDPLLISPWDFRARPSALRPSRRQRRPREPDRSQRLLRRRHGRHCSSSLDRPVDGTSRACWMGRGAARA